MLAWVVVGLGLGLWTGLGLGVGIHPVDVALTDGVGRQVVGVAVGIDFVSSSTEFGIAHQTICYKFQKNKIQTYPTG